MTKDSIPQKRCYACGRFFPATTEFFHRDKDKKDGLRVKCKLCCKEYYQEWSKKPENRERTRNWQREYRKTKHGSEVYKTSWVKLKNRYPNRMKARHALSNAVHNGKLPSARTLKCSNCGSPADSYHHHKGYNKEHALDVIPLCRLCHEKADHTE